MKAEYCAYSPEFYKVTGIQPKLLASLYKIAKKYRFVENFEWFIHKSYIVPILQLAVVKGEVIEYDSLPPELMKAVDKLKEEWSAAFSEKTLENVVQDHDKVKWFGVLYLTPDAPEFIVKAVWRALARKLHPDVGGDPEVFKELNNVYEEVMKHVRG
jgi:hypothetical protein